MESSIIHYATPADLAAYCTSRGPAHARYERPRHVEFVNQLITDAVWAGHGRIIVTEPPRHGKSELVSHRTPVWFLETFPHLFVIEAGYGSEFAQTWGRKCRDTILAHGPPTEKNPLASGILRIRLKSDTRSAGLWYTQEGGGMFSTGVGGPMTGMGGHLVLIDDPIKNEEEAYSDTYREKMWNWWQSVVRTRFEPGATVIIILTRWHEDDLAGRLMEREDSEGWTLINLPAIAEEDDPIGREPGDPLWPYRYSTQEFEERYTLRNGHEHVHPSIRGKPTWNDLDDIRKAVGSYWWNAMFMGHPSPPGGAIFKKEYFQYTYIKEHMGQKCFYLEPHGENRKHVLIDRCWFFQVVDTANKIKTQHDYTVVTTFAVTPFLDLIVLDVARVRLEVPDQWPFIKQQRVNCSYPLRLQGVEDAASGQGIIQVAKREGYPLKPLSPANDPIDRATPVAIMYENRKVYHLRGQHWLADFENELLGFPNATHDDMVTTTSYGGRILIEYREAAPPPAPEREEEIDELPTGTSFDVAVGDGSMGSNFERFVIKKARKLGIYQQ